MGAIKVNVKVKFASEQDLRITEGAAKYMRMDFRTYAAHAIMTYTEALMRSIQEGKKNEQSEGQSSQHDISVQSHDTTPPVTSGDNEQEQSSEATDSDALSNAESNAP